MLTLRISETNQSTSYLTDRQMGQDMLFGCQPSNDVSENLATLRNVKKMATSELDGYSCPDFCVRF